MVNITREAIELHIAAHEWAGSKSEAMFVALRAALDEAERERLAINLLLQAIHNGIYEYGVPDAHPLHQLVHEAIGSSQVSSADGILGAATTTHIADLNAQVSTLRARCDAAIARAEAAEHDRDRLEWMMVNGSGYPFRLQGVDSSWSVCDLRNGLTFVARNSATPREAIDQARAVLAKEGGDGAAGMARRGWRGGDGAAG